MSSEASINSVAPSSAFTRAFAMMCSSGKLRPTLVAGEQNWHPRPHPRVISSTPKVDRCLTIGISSTDGWSFFWNFDNAFECRVAFDYSFENTAEDPFDLAVDQIVYVK